MVSLYASLDEVYTCSECESLVSASKKKALLTLACLHIFQAHLAEYKNSFASVLLVNLAEGHAAGIIAALAGDAALGQ